MNKLLKTLNRHTRDLNFQAAAKIQIYIVVCLLVSEVFASLLFFLLNPTGAISAWYPTIWHYAGEHLITAAIFWAVLIAVAWFLISPGYWRSIRRTREGQFIYLGFIAGAGMDLLTSMYMRFLSFRATDENRMLSHGSVPAGLATRLLIWACIYLIMAWVVTLVSKAIGKATGRKPPRRFSS